MVIDDKVIFIHNPRASGTAIRRALLLGAEPNENIPAKFNRPGDGWYNRKHAFAAMVRAEVPARVWSRRVKFAVVRNPFDRMVSLYGLFRRLLDPEVAPTAIPVRLHKLVAGLRDPDVTARMPKSDQIALHQLACEQDFKSWLMWFCDRYVWNGCGYLGDRRPMTRIQQVEWFDGLDHVFKFEQRGEIDGFLAKHGYPVPVTENQTQHARWETYYDAESHDRVAEVFRDDIRRYGY